MYALAGVRASFQRQLSPDGSMVTLDGSLSRVL